MLMTLLFIRKLKMANQTMCNVSVIILSPQNALITLFAAQFSQRVSGLI